MSSKILFLIIVGIGAGTVFFLFSREAPAEGDAVEACRKDPIAFQEYGEDTLASFVGKPVIVNSWATWCPFCVDEMPDFAAIQNEFGDKIAVIAVNRRESAEQNQEFICKLGIRNDLQFFLDADDSFYREIGGFSMPETLFVDRNGVVVDHKRGPMDADEIRERLQAIL